VIYCFQLLLSTSAFRFNLRRYNEAERTSKKILKTLKENGAPLKEGEGEGEVEGRAFHCCPFPAHL
jgi:hypothetical protein